LAPGAASRSLVFRGSAIKDRVVLVVKFNDRAGCNLRSRRHRCSNRHNRTTANVNVNAQQENSCSFCTDKSDKSWVMRCSFSPNGAGCHHLAQLHAVAMLLAIAIAVSGCSLPQWARNGFQVGPEYRKPVAAIADDWIDSNDPRVLEQPPEHADWWAVFQDPVLNDLVQTGYQQNLTLREAGARVLQARAQRAVVAGNLFPQEQAISGGYSRKQIGVLAQPSLLPAPGFQRSFDDWLVAGNLSWELDIWGRFRRAIESADAGLDASVEEYDAILVCLIAEVVTAYIDIRTFEQRLQYARQNVQTQEKSLQLTQAREEEGKTGKISVYLSESNLEATKASIRPLEIGLRQANNRLCTLLGQPTVDLFPSLGEGHIPAAPAEVAIGIPADLLRRRPDVRAAERRVAAQSAQIGVAAAELYPSIAITGEIFVSAEEFQDLFKSLSTGGSIGPSFRWNVLNYGRIMNNVNVQDARFQELIATYQNAVLTANEEVESALVSFLQTQEQVKSLAASVQATQQALELELLNFKEGETDFSGVFVLQGDLAVKQDQLAASQGEVVASLVAVYKALGGGWQIRCPEFHSRFVSSPQPLSASSDETPNLEATEFEELPPLPEGLTPE
jgi:NodT family efflux transporter outer membrane factor (OMF) lipoprotein